MRLVLPAFRHVRSGAELDRSLDVEEIDAALARIAKILNGGITEENFAAALKFAIGATAGTVQNAWENPNSRLVLVGQATNIPGDLAGGVTAIGLGVVGVSTWTPLKVTGLLLSDSTAPTVTLYSGATALSAATASTAVADTSKYVLSTAKTAYEFTISSFLGTAAAGALVRISSTQPIYGVSTVTASFSAAHLA